MTSTDLKPIARTAMLVRASAEDAYRAFIEPEMLTRFWLAAASGPLSIGASVKWDFMVPGATVNAQAKILEAAKRIEVAWSDGTHVVWRFSPGVEGATVIELEHSGFSGSPQQQIDSAIGSTSGFSMVLCDLKVLLESGVSPGLVRDMALHLASAKRQS